MRLRNPLSLFRIWDVVIVVLLLLLVALTLCFALGSAKGASAEIYLGGKLYRRVDLSKDCEIDLEHLTVIVEKVAIRVCDADCPDKICEERGAISKAGQTIVCLPNRIVIKVVGKGEVEAIT